MRTKQSHRDKIAAQRHPALMDPELERMANDLNSEQRRYMAEKLARWVEQLRFSADFIEQFQSKKAEYADDAEALALAANLEAQAVRLRQHLRLRVAKTSAPPRPVFQEN